MSERLPTALAIINDEYTGPAPVIPRYVIEALKFYAEGEHRTSLYGRIDWGLERERMENNGFVLDGESSNGTEFYTEIGGMAERALEQLRKSGVNIDG